MITTLCSNYPIGRPSINFQKDFAKLMLKKFNLKIRTCYNSCKVGQFFSLKDGCPAFLASNVVYKFTCSLDEGISYIGKTERHLFTRVQEHLTPSHNSAVNQHIAQCRECQNKANKSNFSIIRKCQSSQVVSLHESFLIRQLKPILNVQLYNNGGTLLNIF